MKVNGESIYATTASPFYRLPWGRCTKKVSDDGATLYLHVFEWPKDGKLLVPGLGNKVQSARLLATDQKLKTKSGDDGVTIDVPAEPLDPIATVIVLEVKGKLQVEKVLPGQSADGSITLLADLADTHGQPQVESIDGQSSIGWWTDPKDSVSWTFKVDKPGRFDVMATAATPAASSKFEVVVNGQKLPAEVASTGGYQTFKTVKLGTIEIKQGPTELSIKPLRDGWQAINLRSIVLTPVK